MSHTPTPWGQYGRLVLDTPESVGGYYIVRQMLPSQPGKTPRPAGYDVVAFVRSPEDARLTAAAPDLLDACESLATLHAQAMALPTKDLCSEGILKATQNAWTKVHAAIAKAKETKPCS